MAKYVLKTNRLSKSYKDTKSLSDVSVALEAGKIYGLVGRNGAGKSTFMKLVAGLSFPTSGSLELFGHSNKQALQAERKRVGCMIEYPSLDLNLSASENMRMHRILRGVPNKEVEQELLTLVGLNDTKKKKAKNFSLGMKQRLGIAIALLNSPEFLILDEPINGLDPLGVIDIRNLLKKLCEEKQITILISSHNLPELYHVATDYIFIHHGEIKQTLSRKELDERCSQHLSITCDQPEKLTSVLEMELQTTNYKVMPDNTVKVFDYLSEKEKVAQTLFKHGLAVTNFSVEGDTLEDYFISVVGGAENE
ncbi:ABC transporter ATP-binding protein [Bacillus horti]|uniref:ABC-2 type transport system ATP-binding protein n=1 Tax=Caldalkalibacillus horti TaxID=77523 RepID=A0ABT9W0G8_9BACI|nr:ABC transporter ATP-binding protein [Bacillus horti]MDQ0166722.1 ABC-2 type transport system ATP-binding protein [Bacillus horti]